MEENILNFLKINGMWWIVGFIILFYLKELISNMAKSHSEAIMNKMNIKVPKIINTSKSFMMKNVWIFVIMLWVFGLFFSLYSRLSPFFSELQLSALLGAFSVAFFFIIIGFVIMYFSVFAKQRDYSFGLMLSLYQSNLKEIAEMQNKYKEDISSIRNSIKK